MITATRPYNEAAFGPADEDIYAAHEGDRPRPNALFDADGNRLKLDPTNTDHLDLCEEWLRLYEKHGGEIEDSDDHPKTPPDKPCEDCKTARLTVVVRDADGNPVEGADVYVDGIGGMQTNEKGVADFGEVQPGTYDILATKSGHAPDTTGPTSEDAKAANFVRADVTNVVELIQHPLLSVEIALDKPVACPGHPLEMTATGAPPGGTYEWAASGHGAQLVDDGGKPSTIGETLSMRCFKPDDTTGEIPERVVTVVVTYTHPTLGTVEASKPVTVHAVSFLVEDLAIRNDGTDVLETEEKLLVGRAESPSIIAKAVVSLIAAASCPRRSACENAYNLGWVQNVTSDRIKLRYPSTLLTTDLTLPILDSDAVSKPWLYVPTALFATPTETSFDDFPALVAPWMDERQLEPGEPAGDRDLRRVEFHMGFRVWLSVGHIEWSYHDKPGSFVWLRNFGWSVDLKTPVNVSRPLKTRCSPISISADIVDPKTGRGSHTPELTGKAYNKVVQSAFRWTRMPPL